MDILYATDFSNPAKNAGNVAAALAFRLGAKLHVVHVFHGSYTPPSGAFLGLLKASAQKLIDSEVKRLRALGASVEEHLLDGLPDPEVVRLAKTINARFIVIGSLGRSQSERWLLGSVAERVAETAPCPTLVVRDSLPLHAWAQGKFPLRIVCGVDFTATSDAALASLRALSGIGAMEITAAYVSWPFEERERLGIDGGDSPVADSQAVTKIRERDLCERVAAVIGEKKPHIHVEAAHNRVDYTLIEFARASNAGLVAIGTHQIHGLRRLMNPSFSRGILYHAHTNVWCAPLHMEGYHPPVRKLDRILVATDFSDSANAAIRQSYSLLTNGGVVHLLHVLSASPKSRGLPGTRGKSSSLATGVRRAKQDAESKLRRSIPKELSTMRVATEIEVVEHEDTASAICQAAERYGAHMICVGTRSHGRLASAVIGSVAQQVISKSKCPVLAVPSLQI